MIENVSASLKESLKLVVKVYMIDADCASLSVRELLKLSENVAENYAYEYFLQEGIIRRILIECNGDFESLESSFLRWKEKDLKICPENPSAVETMDQLSNRILSYTEECTKVNDDNHPSVTLIEQQLKSVVGNALAKESIEFLGIHAVGSSKSNLSLPETSDIDLVVLASRVADMEYSPLDIIHIIAEALPKDMFTVIEIASEARVPVLRLLDSSTNKKVILFIYILAIKI